MENLTLQLVFPSIYGRIAYITALEKGIDVTIKVAKTKAAEHRSVHPFGKIPVLEWQAEDGLQRIVETKAIVRYIDEALPGPSLQPQDHLAKAKMNEWLEFIDHYFVPCMIARIVKPRLLEPLEGKPPNETLIAENLPEAIRQLKLVEEHLENCTWLSGDKFGLADIYLLPLVEALLFVPDMESTFKETPKLNHWHDKMQERASVKESLSPPA